MKVLIKKEVWENYLKEYATSRGDTIYNNTTGFYGNFGSVKSFKAGEEGKDDDIEFDNSPIEPSSQMAVQLSVDEPPVDDPDFIPATIQELGLAAARISKEVPSEKIEYFYRKLHKLLDSALDENDKKLFNLEEAIDYDSIPNPAHRKAIKGIIDQASTYVTRSNKPISKEEAAQFAAQQRMISRYPYITFEDVLDEIENFIIDQEDESSEEDLIGHVEDILTHGKESDIITNPPGDLKDLSPPGGTIPSKGKRKKIASKKKKNLADPSDESLDKRAEDEMMHMMASAYSEYVEMDEYAATWDWTNYQYEAPMLKVTFDLIKILHQLSYRMLQANYINKYGGYIYDPEADVGGGKKGGFVLEKQGPTSRPEAQAMIRRINSDFGLTYKTIMRQRNILDMTHQELVAVIERAMIGIFTRVPALYRDFIQAVALQAADRIAQGEDVESIRNEAFGWTANALAHKYRGESEVLDKDLVSLAISGIFKRCLLDLPLELGFSPSVTVSLDTIGQKKTQKTDVTRGFNLLGAMRRFEKLRKDPKIAKEVKKLLPALILKRITETKTAKVTKSGTKYNFEDKTSGLGMEVKQTDLKKSIKSFVDGMLQGKQPSYAGDDEATEPQDMGAEPYDEAAEEKEAKSRLSKDDYETRKIVQEMEKMVASGDWMHIAPLFGFSGAPGVRQWYLRYPERKLMIMTAARSDRPPAGAKTYLEVFREMRANLGNNLITLSPNKPGVLDLMIDEISSKESLATSDQLKIELLEEMRDNVEDILNLYENYESYEALEEQNPEELERLSKTPGGSLLRFGIGSVFDKIIKDMDTEWHSEMKEYLETKNGLKSKDAHDLAYYFTGLKNKPSKGDFSEDRAKLSNAAAAFVNVGMQAEEFFKALRYSQGWFFSTLDRELNKEFKGDNYYKLVHDLTSLDLYTSVYSKDKKTRTGFKLNKKAYTVFKNLIDGKNGAISAYLDNLAIEQFQQNILKKVKKIKSDRPDIFN